MGDNRKERIAALAMGLMQRQGYTAVGLRDVARLASLRAPSLYNHFASKDDLAREAMRLYARGQKTRLARLDKLGTGAKRLRGYTELFSEMLRDDERLCLGLILAVERNVLRKDVLQEVRVFVEQNTAWLATTWEAGVADGTIHLDLPSEVAARLIFGALEGFMAFALLDPSPVRVFLGQARAFLAAIRVELPGRLASA